MFELPLFGGFFAGLKKAQAVGVGLAPPSGCPAQAATVLVKTSGCCQRLGPGRKLCSRLVRADLLEVEVGEVELHCGASVFVGEIDAGDAFVVGGEREWNAGGAIGRKRMPGVVTPRMTSFEVRLISTMM